MSYPKDVRTAVGGAFYPRALAAADAARTRAQAGYTIASAIAAALVAAGILTDISDRPSWVQSLAMAALAAWLLTAVLFMWAVAVPVNLSLPAVLPNADAFVDAVLANARSERNELGVRTVNAFAATVVAIVLTLTAMALVLFVPAEVSTTTATVALTTEGSATIEAMCGESAGTITASVDPDDLTDKYVPLTIASCNGKLATVHLPQRDVLGVSAEDS